MVARENLLTSRNEFDLKILVAEEVDSIPRLHLRHEYVYDIEVKLPRKVALNLIDRRE